MRPVLVRTALRSFASSLVLLASPAAAEPAAFLVREVGAVEVAAGRSAPFRAADVGEELHTGDVVRTGPGAAAKILMAEDALLALGEESELEIRTGRSVFALRGSVRSLAATDGFQLHLADGLVQTDAADLEVRLDEGEGPPWLVCIHEGEALVRGPRGVRRTRTAECTAEGADGGLEAFALRAPNPDVPGNDEPPTAIVDRGAVLLLPPVGAGPHIVILKPVPTLQLVLVEPDPIEMVLVEPDPLEMEVVEPDPLEMEIAEPDPIDLILTELPDLELQLAPPLESEPDPEPVPDPPS